MIETFAAASRRTTDIFAGAAPKWLRAKGHRITIISEAQFLRLIRKAKL